MSQSIPPPPAVHVVCYDEQGQEVLVPFDQLPRNFRAIYLSVPDERWISHVSLMRWANEIRAETGSPIMDVEEAVSLLTAAGAHFDLQRSN